MSHGNYKATKWAKSARFGCCFKNKDGIQTCREDAVIVCTKHPKRNWCGNARCKKHVPKKRTKPNKKG